MGFRRSLVRIQSPRHLRLVVTTGYGKPFSFTFSGPGTLWARIEPETAPKPQSFCHHIQVERSLPVASVCSTRPNLSTTCEGLSTASRRFSRPPIRIAHLSGNQGV